MAVRHHQHLPLLFFFFLGGVVATVNLLQLSYVMFGWPTMRAEVVHPAPTHMPEDIRLIRQLNDASRETQKQWQGCQRDLQRVRDELRTCIQGSNAGTLPR